MQGRPFFDTNVLIYALAQNDFRSDRAEELLRSGGVLSVQVLNEFVSVARRKLLMPWQDVTDALAAVRVLCPDPIPLTIEVHDAAVEIAQKYGYGIYDALVIASAIDASYSTLFSEDLRDGQVTDGRLTVQNPF
jgi:predicted nucleic acid-binding protein